MAEFFDLYDEQLKPLGITHKRGDPFEGNELHHIATVFSVNRQGKILITKRHPDKPYGGMWEISGGSVISGETPLEGAKRELFEETGLDAELSELLYMGQIIRHYSHCIHNFYLYEGDFSAEDIRLQEGETVDFKLVTPARLAKMAEDGKFLDFSFNRIRAVYADFFFTHI